MAGRRLGAVHDDQGDAAEDGQRRQQRAQPDRLAQPGGVPQPAHAASIGYPDFHLVMVVAVGDPVGCQVPVSVPWLSLDRLDGQVEPGEGIDVQVSIDGSALAAGTHESQLCVLSNDPAQPLVSVPVSLVVADDPDVIFSDGFE